MNQRVQVREAGTAADYDAAADLMRCFVQWHRKRHVQDLELIDRYFDDEAYAQELAHLDERYGPPNGALLVAEVDGKVAGCVALKRLDGRACEMKRMFVDESYRGLGLGKALGKAIVARAKASGYTRMLLDTSFRQKEAMNLYEQLGFRRIAPYYDLPEELAAWLVFYELELTEQPPQSEEA
jgi:GNAT superfamily N-acetyltransferase